MLPCGMDIRGLHTGNKSWHIGGIVVTVGLMDTSRTWAGTIMSLTCQKLLSVPVIALWLAKI